MLQYFSQVQNGSAFSHCMQTTGPRAINTPKKTVPERLVAGQDEARTHEARRSPLEKLLRSFERFRHRQ
jgi:hypothetical protein